MLTGMRRRRASADHGAGSAELAVATPLLMLLVLLVVQFAVWAHATGVAQATAAERWSPPASRAAPPSAVNSAPPGCVL